MFIGDDDVCHFIVYFVKLMKCGELCVHWTNIKHNIGVVNVLNNDDWSWVSYEWETFWWVLIKKKFNLRRVKRKTSKKNISKTLHAWQMSNTDDIYLKLKYFIIYLAKKFHFH